MSLELETDWNIGSENMRRVLVPLVFVLLVTLAAVVPAAASAPDAAPVHSGPLCEGKI